MPQPQIARDVIDDVRAACESTGRATTAEEVERALDGLSPAETDLVRRIARGALDAAPLGPDALIDVARGVDPDIAASRELSGYYEMQAERNALALLAGRRRAKAAARDVDSDDEDDAPAPPDALGEERVRLRKPRAPHERPAEVETLLTLFAYHRDPVRVAQELGVGLDELQERIESHGLRRKLQTLLERTTDIDVFSTSRTKPRKEGASLAPRVRKPHEKPAAPTFDEPPVPDWAPAQPAARTDPVNVHGTRVFRLREAVVTKASTPVGAGLREYVRESRKKRSRTTAGQSEHTTVRKAVEAPTPMVPARAAFAELQATTGRVVLERMLADEKANPRAFVAALGARYEGPGRPLAESDLRQLLAHHGLLAQFTEREQVNTRFLIGFHQGARAKLANALQMSPDELGAYLARVGLSGELEKVRAERARQELGKKRTADRVAQVLTRAPYLEDLGVLTSIDDEVRAEVTRAFAAGGTNEAAREALGVDTKAFIKLLKRYGLGA